MSFWECLSWAAGLVFLLPLTSSAYVPQMIKGALATAIAVLAFLVHGAAAPIATGVLPAVFNVILMFIVGAIAGFVTRMFVMVFALFGSFVSNYVALSQLFPSASGEMDGIFSRMARIFGMLAILMSDLHIWGLVLLMDQPRGAQLFVQSLLVQTEQAPRIFDMAQSIFVLAFYMAAPFAVFALIYNISLGFLSRIMPQFMGLLIMAPVTLMAGMIGFLIWGAILLDPVQLLEWSFFVNV